MKRSGRALDGVRPELDAFETVLSEQLGSFVQIQHDFVARGEIEIVEFSPRRPEAAPMRWVIMRDMISFEAGRKSGGSWELMYLDARDISFLESATRAVIEGRIKEVWVWGRSRTTLLLFDGEKAHSTGYSLSVPLLGWPRWGRRRHFAPYLPGAR